MTVIVISSQQVKEVRRDGIVYVDADGNEQFIDFEACYQRELARQLDPEQLEEMKSGNRMTDEQLEEWIVFLKDPDSKYIGGRNVFGERFTHDGQLINGLPHVEFYTEPVTLIEFPTRNELEQLRYQVERVFKWRTHDLA